MERIVACVDHTSATEVILRHAAELARRTKAELVVLHVVAEDPAWVGWGPGPQTVRRQVAAQLREAHRKTQELARKLRACGIPRARALTVQGPTPETILERAEALDASVIVLGAHHRGAIYELFVGSIARSVLRQTTRPILVVPERRVG